MTDCRPDFVIAQVGNKSGYISTNLKEKVYKIFTTGDLRRCIVDIKRNYTDYIYTFEGIIPCEEHQRYFTDYDYIYKNKILNYIEKTDSIRGKECLQR